MNAVIAKVLGPRTLIATAAVILLGVGMTPISAHAASTPNCSLSVTAPYVVTDGLGHFDMLTTGSVSCDASSAVLTLRDKLQERTANGWVTKVGGTESLNNASSAQIGSGISHCDTGTWRTVVQAWTTNGGVAVLQGTLISRTVVLGSGSC